MPRANFDATLAAAMASPAWSPVLLASIQFRSQTLSYWTGLGSLTWNGITFAGIGTMGKLGVSAGEGGAVMAAGAQVSASGLDATLLGEIMADLLPNGAAALWLGAWQNGGLLGTPYALFGGYLGQASVAAGAPTPDQPNAQNLFTIALSLETSLKQLNRPSSRRYTAADQRLYYADDSGFNFMMQEADIAVRWG